MNLMSVDRNNISNYISAVDYANKSGDSEESVVKMVRDGVLVGKLIDDMWYIYAPPSRKSNAMQDKESDGSGLQLKHDGNTENTIKIAVLKITAVMPGSHGESIGLQSGDLILSYDGRRVESNLMLSNFQQYAKTQGREKVAVEIERDGVEITYQTPPRTLGIECSEYILKKKAKESDPSISNEANAVQDNGTDESAIEITVLQITTVMPGSQGESIGLQSGDLILSYDGNLVGSNLKLSNVQHSAKSKGRKKVNIKVERDGAITTYRASPVTLGIECSEYKIKKTADEWTDIDDSQERASVKTFIASIIAFGIAILICRVAFGIEVDKYLLVVCGLLTIGQEVVRLVGLPGHFMIIPVLAASRGNPSAELFFNYKLLVAAVVVSLVVYFVVQAYFKTESQFMIALRKQGFENQ
jgi:hypothetical protein